MRAVAVLAAIVLSTAAAARKCERISIPLCKDIGYNYTSYPNIYEHVKQEEAGLEVHQFYPLVEYGCFKHLKFFLCTLYTPICQENYDMSILPCKELCLQARDQCSPIMKQYGFRWPQTLSCDSLPSRDEQATTGRICAAPPDTPSTKGTRKTTRPSSRVTQQPSIDNGPQISYDCDCTCASPFVFQKGSSVAGVADCAYPCSTNILSTKEKGFIQNWMAVWSIACIVASSFTLLTFLIEPDRFQYPERPIFVLAFCQLMVAIGIVIRVGMGHEAIACNSNTLKPDGDGDSTLCFFVFLLTYFFGMAASVWWVLLSLTWVLAAGSKWSSEAIASYSVYFHITGWALPAIQTGMVLAFSAVDGDSVTGLCFVGNTNIAHLRIFVIAPLVVYFTIGVFFLMIGFFNLWRIRSEVSRQYPAIEGAGRLTRLMSKIGIFSMLYALPALLTILLFCFEQENRPQWEQAAMCPCVKSANRAHHSVVLWLSLLKTMSFLLLGCATGFWVLSPKTFASWRAKMCCGTPGRASSTAKYQPADMIYAKSDCSGGPSPVYFNSTLRQHHQHHKANGYGL